MKRDWNKTKIEFYKTSLAEVDEILSNRKAAYASLINFTQTFLETLADMTADGLAQHPRAREIEVTLNMTGVFVMTLCGILDTLVRHAPKDAKTPLADLLTLVTRKVFHEGKEQWLDEMQNLIYEKSVEDNEGSEQIDVSKIVDLIKRDS